MNWKNYLVAVLLSSMILALAFIQNSGSQTTFQYDPWADINDDGKIDAKDIGYTCRLFGKTGDPSKPVVIQGYNWSLKSYTVNIPARKGGSISFPTAGYKAITIGLSANTSSTRDYVSVRTSFLLGNHHAYLESFNVPLTAYLADRHTEFPDCMWIEPVNINLTDKPLGYTFNVTVWVKISSSASYTWQVKLYYDTTFLKAKRAGYTVGAMSEWATHRTGGSTAPVTPVIEENYVMYAESLVGDNYVPAPVTASLCWIEFEVIGAPTGKSTLSISNADTYVLNPYLDEIYPMFKQDATIIQLWYITRTYTVIGPVLTIEYYNPNDIDVTLNIAAYLTT
jgi:hypothetical protein